MKTNCKLINLFILTLFILIFLPLISEAAYNVYLKNGRVMTGVDEVKEESGTIKIYKKGVVLELPKTNILRIEEYGTDSIKKETVEEKVTEEAPTEEQLPEYLRYDKLPETPPVVYEEDELEETEDDIEEETEEEAEEEGKPSKKKHKLSQEHIDSLPDTPAANKFKDFTDTLPDGVISP